jgi:hypothetical protein
MSDPTFTAMIRGVDPRRPTAIELAHACYKKWKGMASFQEDLTHYLLYGVVISHPTLFGMAKVIDLAEPGAAREPAWFVRFACGDLVDLLSSLPCHLPKICFCRNNKGAIRVYNLDKLFRLAVRLHNGARYE